MYMGLIKNNFITFKSDG